MMTVAPRGYSRRSRCTVPFFFFQAEDGIRDVAVTGVQTCALPIFTDRTLIRRHFPYLADDTVALFHGRRCGWLSGQQLGMHMLERARDKGVRLMQIGRASCRERV